jgi:hypothetical protein
MLLLTAACEDFLSDRQEATAASQEMDYGKTENIFLPVSAAYATLRASGVHQWAYINLYEIASDDADKGSIPGDGAPSKEIDEFTFTAAHGLVNEAWTANYNTVSAANYAIHTMPLFEAAQSKTEDKEYARQCQSEAKVIRAYAYFNLVRLFGRVYIADTVYTADQLSSLPQREAKEIYVFIEKNLSEALAELPNEYGGGWEGRITRYTALAIKAKVHLHQPEADFPHKWDSVAACAGRIIKSGNFDLLPNFRDVFRSKGENSVESLFEIQASTQGKTTGDAPYMEYAFFQGPRANTPSNMQGWGFCVPSQSLVTFLTQRGETIRKDVTLMKAAAEFEGSYITRAANCPEYYNGKTFSPPSENKWSYNGYGFDYNVRVLRYADVLLMYAEALQRGGIDPLAAMGGSEALNKVHRRAGFTEDLSLSLDNILDERHAELALEEDRYFDLIRQGEAAATAALGAGFTYAKHRVFPIPANQRQLNGGLEQNSGY